MEVPLSLPSPYIVIGRISAFKMPSKWFKELYYNQNRATNKQANAYSF
jgi:hypothetical protein